MKHIGIAGFELEKINTKAGAARMLSELLQYITLQTDIEQQMKITIYFRDRIPEDPILNHPVFIKKVLKFIKPSFSLYYNMLLPHEARKDKVDFVFFPTFMLPLFYNGKSIVVIHDTIFKAHPEWFPWKHRIAYRLLINRAARKATQIHTDCNDAKKDIIRLYGVEPKRIVVTHLGIDPQKSTAKLSNNEIDTLKAKYGLTTKRFIFYTGQIMIRRRVKESMLAFEKISHNFPDMQFLVSHRDVSVPPQHIDDLAKQINQRMGREAIVRTKFVDEQDLHHIYGLAKLFVYASEYEGFGLPPAEATMHGTPSLTGNNGAAKEIFSPNGAFFVDNPSNVNEIAKVMYYALTDESKRASVVYHGQENLKSYTWERYCKQVLKLWKEFPENSNE